MIGYKAPFQVKQDGCGGFDIIDAAGLPLSLSNVVALLNAHARLSAQRCETCRFKEDKLSAALNSQILCGRTRTVETLPHGCTAYQPKEDGK